MSMNTVQDIREALFSHADEGYKAFQCPLMPTVDPSTVIGVRTPVLRRMAKELKGTAGREEFLRDLPHAYFEENLLHAFLIEQEKDFTAAIEHQHITQIGQITVQRRIAHFLGVVFPAQDSYKLLFLVITFVTHNIFIN